MALDDNDIKKISDGISGAISKGFGDISSNLERIITQQKTNIPDSALNYRGANFGRRIYGEDIEQQLKRLARDLERQYADTRSATNGNRLFGGISTPARELNYEKERVKDANQSLENTIEELKNAYDLAGDSQKEIVENAKRKFKELGDEIEKLKKKLDSADTSPEEKEEAAKRLNELEEERKNIGEGLAKVYEKSTDSLREQARYAELSISTMKQGISDISSGFGKLKRLGLDLAEGWRKVDQASANFAKNIGIGSKGLVALRKNTMDMIANKGIGLNYGIGMEELVQIQQGYMKSTGRNVGLTAEDIETGAAMSRVMGDKGGEFAQALENFGLSYTEAGKRAGKMFADASKAGLSFEKYSDNFLKNIKMAQKYTFRDGLKGLERMAKKATEIRMDMQSIANFADKVSTLQGAAETSAQLQVLGGSFAQFSDPLGMLNEGLNDMEGLMNRVDKMMNNMAKFNSQTGQVDINTFNRQRLRAAAQAMNIPYEQLLETAQEKGRRNFVNQQLNVSGRKYTDEQREFLMNTATVQNGKAVVSYLDKQGNRVTRNVSDIEGKEIEQARAQNQSDSDNIKSIAKATMSMDEQIEGFHKTVQTIKANAIEKPMEWIKEKLNGLSGYLQYIKIALGIIIGAKAISGVVGVGKGTVNTVRGAYNFLKSGSIGGAGASAAANAAGGATRAGSYVGGLGKFGGAAGRALGLARVGGGVFSLGAGIYNAIEASKADNYADKYAGYGKAAGNVLGAAAMFIPGIGPFIAAGIAAGAPLLGKWLGKTIGKKKDEKIAERRKIESKDAERVANSLRLSGFDLKGGYTALEYKQIMSAINHGGDGTITRREFESLPEELKNKLIASEDVSLFPELQELTVKDATIDTENVTMNAGSVNIVDGAAVPKKEKGGMLFGPSHSMGGIPLIAEGGEYIINKNATKKHFGLLTAINADKYGGGGQPGVQPSNNEGMKPVKVLAALDGGNGFSGGGYSGVNNVNVNISGTIKLDGGNGRTVDMTALLRDPVFIRQITNLIEQQMIFNAKGARFTNKLRR